MLQVIQKTSIHHLDEIFFLANTVLDPKVASCEFDFEYFFQSIASELGNSS